MQERVDRAHKVVYIVSVFVLPALPAYCHPYTYISWVLVLRSIHFSTFLENVLIHFCVLISYNGTVKEAVFMLYNNGFQVWLRLGIILQFTRIWVRIKISFA